MEENRIREQAENILKELSLEEKAELLSQYVWETTDIHQKNENLEKFLLADGPAGIRRLKDYFDEDIYNTRKNTCYPSPGTYASSWDKELIHRLGKYMGEEARQEEVDTMLAPAVNIKRSPLGGRNFEYYSEDPYLTSELATEFIKGIQEKGVGACLKHFAANNQETRRMNINEIIDEETLHEVYLESFEKPVKQGKPKMIMMGYNQINGEYCASNPMLLELLRKEWGYEGVAVTDCYAAHDLEKGIAHGLTLQMPGEKPKKIVKQIKTLIQEGKITEQQLDQAVWRNICFTLEAKNERQPGYTYDREEHHRFARKIARESMVLLRNEENILPLGKEEKILVVGELAVHPRFQGGGSSHVNPWRLEVPLEEMQKKGQLVDFLQGYKIGGNCKENQKLESDVLEVTANYDKIVIFAGLPEIAESEGYDRTSLKLPPEQDSLIEHLAGAGVNIIVALSNGSVVEMPWRNKVSAILECYLGGEAGASAAADLLFGDANPCGKLAETFPERLEDTPSYLFFPGNKEQVVYGEGRFVGYKFYDAVKRKTAYPFGHGLSYTEFEYKKENGLQVDLENKTAVLAVKNKGSRAGYEIVQIYARREAAWEGVSPKKLVGFAKIYLEPGEEKEVSISLYEKGFMCYSCSSHRWEIANGTYRVQAGRSVEDIRLETVIKRENVAEIVRAEKRDCCDMAENITTAVNAVTAESTLGDLVRIPGMYEKLEAVLKIHPESFKFLEMTKSDDPLKAMSMGGLMTFQTLMRADETLYKEDIAKILEKLNASGSEKYE